MKRLNFFFNLKKSKEAKMPKIRKMDISGPELANEKDVRSLIDRAPAIKEFLENSSCKDRMMESAKPIRNKENFQLPEKHKSTEDFWNQCKNEPLQKSDKSSTKKFSPKNIKKEILNRNKNYLESASHEFEFISVLPKNKALNNLSHNHHDQQKALADTDDLKREKRHLITNNDHSEIAIKNYLRYAKDIESRIENQYIKNLSAYLVLLIEKKDIGADLTNSLISFTKDLDFCDNFITEYYQRNEFVNPVVSCFYDYESGEIKFNQLSERLDQFYDAYMAIKDPNAKRIAHGFLRYLERYKSDLISKDFGNSILRCIDVLSQYHGLMYRIQACKEKKPENNKIQPGKNIPNFNRLPKNSVFADESDSGLESSSSIKSHSSSFLSSDFSDSESKESFAYYDNHKKQEPSSESIYEEIEETPSASSNYVSLLLLNNLNHEPECKAIERTQKIPPKPPVRSSSLPERLDVNAASRNEFVRPTTSTGATPKRSMSKQSSMPGDSGFNSSANHSFSSDLNDLGSIKSINSDSSQKNVVSGISSSKHEPIKPTRPAPNPPSSLQNKLPSRSKNNIEEQKNTFANKEDHTISQADKNKETTIQKSDVSSNKPEDQANKQLDKLEIDMRNKSKGISVKSRIATLKRNGLHDKTEKNGKIILNMQAKQIAQQSSINQSRL